MVDRLFRTLKLDARFGAWVLRERARLGDAASVTTDLRRVGLGEGAMHSHFAAGALVTLIDGRFERNEQWLLETKSDLLLIRATLDSDCAYVPLGGPAWHFHQPALTVSVVPEGTRMDIAIAGGSAQRTVTLVLEPRFLLQRHGVDPAELPAPLRRLMEGRLEVPQTVVSMPLDADIAGLVLDLTRSRLTGSLRRMQVEARSAELLALVAAAWNDHLAAQHCPGGRTRDAEIVRLAERMLAEHFAHPPTLQALARRLGTNKNKLTQLFQRSHGTTPQMYCLRRRIERAQALIAEGRLSLGQVAEAVGYQHQSSFTVAFREVVGLAPREYALRHAGARAAGAGMVVH